MITALTVVHVIVCFFLIVVVLLQSGKAADLAGAFGGMGSQTAFGPRGSATVLSKATTIAAVLFMVTSLSLSILYTRRGSGAGVGASVLDHTAPAKSSAPAIPAQPTGGRTVPVQIPVPPVKK
jgi:preprotein translocase subunit SecG